MKELYIVIACDVDPDRDSFLPGQNPKHLAWRGMLEGIPLGKEKTRSLVDSNGKSPRFTWCLRVDHQISRLCGAYDYVLAEHTSFLLDLERSGDELAWHPHFWRYDDALEKWYQELADRTFQISMLEEAAAAYNRALPGHAKTVRMGWSYHNNETFAALERLGVEVECSAIPGLRISPQNESVHHDGFYDWVGTPDTPYYPSRSDYRRPVRDGEQAGRLLEVPCFMTHSLFWGWLAGAVLSKKMKTLTPLTAAVRRPSYFVNITGKPSLFRPILSSLNARLRRQDRTIFVTYFHADELVEHVHPVYKLEHMLINVKAVIESARRHKATVKFVRAIDLKEILKA